MQRFKVFNRVIRYLRPYLGTFLLAALCMVLFGATDGGIPLLIKYVLDGVFANQDKDLLTLLPVVLVFFAFFRGICDFGQQYLSAKVGHFVVRDIRGELQQHLLGMPPSYFVHHPTADLVSRVSNDVTLLRGLVTDSVSALVRDSIRMTALIVSALYLDAVLALIALVAFPVGIYPVIRFGKKLRKLSRRGQEGVGELSALMQETLIGNRVVKGFGREKFEEARFLDANDRLTRTFVSSERIRALTGPINEVLASVAVAAVILYGGWSVIGGTRSQGEFIAFLVSVFLLYDPFKKLSKVQNAIQQGLAGADRIFELLDTRSPVQDPSSPKGISVCSPLEFKNVTFHYEGSEGPSLSNINLTIHEGQQVALVGFSGAGKSTLIDLIPRFMDPTSGEVLLGGTSLRDFAIKELRSKISIVGQHTFLFHDSIFNNIAYGRDGASRAEVERAASAAYAADFISRLPHGIDTIIGEAGLTLSGGERQRIAIARALLKSAPILILDEATASLDNRAEREVQSALDELKRGRTTITIAHRLSTIRDADLIVVLHNGKIVEQGTHEELLKNDQNTYRKLYDLQFGTKTEE